MSVHITISRSADDPDKYLISLDGYDNEGEGMVLSRERIADALCDLLGGGRAAESLFYQLDQEQQP